LKRFIFPNGLISIKVKDGFLETLKDVVFPSTVTHLDFTKNQLSDLFNVRWPDQLYQLVVNQNRLVRLGDFFDLPYLTNIFALNNRINDLSGCRLPPQVRKIDVRGNLVDLVPLLEKTTFSSNEKNRFIIGPDLNSPRRSPRLQETPLSSPRHLSPRKPELLPVKVTSSAWTSPLKIKPKIDWSELSDEEVDEEVKEPEVKEPEVKEPEVKEPEVKEPEVKEPEVKPSEVSEPKPGKKSKKNKKKGKKKGQVSEPKVSEPKVIRPDGKEPGKKLVPTIRNLPILGEEEAPIVPPSPRIVLPSPRVLTAPKGPLPPKGAQDSEEPKGPSPQIFLAKEVEEAPRKEEKKTVPADFDLGKSKPGAYLMTLKVVMTDDGFGGLRISSKEFLKVQRLQDEPLIFADDFFLEKIFPNRIPNFMDLMRNSRP